MRQKKGDTRSHRHAKESAEYSPTTKPCSCDLMHVSPTSPCPSMEAKTSQYSHASTERRRECRHFPFLGHDSSWLGSGPFSFCVLMHSASPTESHSTVDTNSMDAPFRLCMPFVPLPFSNMTSRNTVHASFQILTLYAYLFET